jgi:hypothetical protein
VILLATADLHGIGAVFGDTRAALGLVVGLGLCGTASPTSSTTLSSTGSVPWPRRA